MNVFAFRTTTYPKTRPILLRALIKRVRPRRLPSSVGKLIGLFPPLSNVTCIVIEQFFYLMCVSLYLRLELLRKDVETLVRRAEQPRWTWCWSTAVAAGRRRPTRLGIPAFGAADIRHMRTVHRACVELFARVNRLFQLPLALCMFDCVFRNVVYMFGVAFDVTVVVWERKERVNYADVGVWLGYSATRIVRLWYLHMCEYYVTAQVSYAGVERIFEVPKPLRFASYVR